MIYSSINYILIVVCIVFGSVFLTMPVPNQKHLNNYKTSLKVLATAYFVFALLTFLMIFFDFFANSGFLSFFTTLQSSIQALLFTSTLLTLYNPTFITKRFLFINILPILILSVFYLGLRILFNEKAMEPIYHPQYILSNRINLLSILFFLYYCFQLAYYTRLFIIEEKKYNGEIDNYFSNNANLSQRWVHYTFYSALFIGILALSFQVFPNKIFDLLFSMILLVFYFIFSIKYINYNKFFVLIEPAIATFSEQETTLRENKEWIECRNEIILKKHYLIESITLNDLSKIINIGRNTLSAYINKEEGVSFNTWINSMRIEEAKKMLRDNPNYTIAKISELTGFTEQSNFSRQFKLITGQSPSVWKKSKIKS